jgi:hypothetical protein
VDSFFVCESFEKKMVCFDILYSFSSINKQRIIIQYKKAYKVYSIRFFIIMNEMLKITSDGRPDRLAGGRRRRGGEEVSCAIEGNCCAAVWLWRQVAVGHIYGGRPLGRAKSGSERRSVRCLGLE